MLDVDTLSSLAGAVVSAAYAEPLCILLGGSVPEGFSTSQSDFDIVAVIQPSEYAYEHAARSQTLRAGARRCEILYVPADSFLNVLNNEPYLDPKNRLDYLDLRRRFLTGIPIYGREFLETRSLDEQRTRFATEVSEYCMTRAHSYIDDVIGLLLGGRFEEAAVASRCYLEHVCDAALASMGDLYHRSKWRLARINRTFSKCFATKTMVDQVITALIGSQADRPSYSQATMRNCQTSLWLSLVTLSSGAGLKQLENFNFSGSQKLLTVDGPPLFLSKVKAGDLILRNTSRAFRVNMELATIVVTKHLENSGWGVAKVLETPVVYSSADLLYRDLTLDLRLP